MSLTSVSFPGQPSRSVHFHLGACKVRPRASLAGPARAPRIAWLGRLRESPCSRRCTRNRHSFPGTCPFLFFQSTAQGNRGAEDSLFSVFSSCAVIGLLFRFFRNWHGSKLPDSSDNRIYPPDPSFAHCSAKRSELAPCPACPSSQPGRNTSHGQEVSGCFYCVSTGAPVVPRLGSRPASGRCGPRSHF